MPAEEPPAEPVPEPEPEPRGRRRRRVWIVAGIAAVLVVGGVGLTLATRGSGPGQARAFSLPRLNGTGTVSLASYRGQPVVVNFFASWCTPCTQEMPALQAVSTKLKGKVAFLGVNHEDDRQGALKLLADTGVEYPTGYDPAGKVATTYGLFGMPTTLFIAPDGRLLEKHTGELTEAQFEQTISRLFGV